MTTQTINLSDYKYGAIQFNDWSKRYCVWLESEAFRSGTDKNAPVLLAQDIDVLWFSDTDAAKDFCKRRGFIPVETMTVYHVSGQVLYL